MRCPLFEGSHAECRKEKCQWWVEAEGITDDGANCAITWIARALIDRVYYFDKDK